MLLLFQLVHISSYFVIPAPNENNLIYLLITQTPEEEIKTVFVVVESLSFLYSSKIIYL